MVEYGHAVGQGASQAGGSGGAAQSGDWGAQLGQAFSDTANTVSAMSPVELLLLGIVIIVGLVILKRAF